MTDVSQLDELPIAADALLTDQEVAAYLRDHPDFFDRQPDVLDGLQVNHPERGAVSLVEIQLTRLRHQVRDLESEIRGLVAAAGKNSELFEIFARAQHQLFQTHNIYQALVILESLAEKLNLEVSLKLFDSFDDTLFLERKAFEPFRIAHLSQRSVYLGRLRKPESELLFDQPPHLGSFVVLPLGLEQPIGVLSFASPDGGHFQPSMDTLFVEQLALVLTRLIYHWEYTREVID
ncbi:DUF484 family protein [Photobacterium sp. TY1-4]|uniref:DUF484 family protein n=1 Tax=Photobacterium sp. TY1-4 TaxID=2899122 RepID=UPI0021BF06FF|nr:DUF484 family protein [Photobacterium sp. TY1-4]UXI01224.1 DUF484 family protein [Photobacterium sp. TY1-4]